MNFLLVLVVCFSIVTSSELFRNLLKLFGVESSTVGIIRNTRTHGKTFRSCFFEFPFLSGHHSLQFPLFLFFLFLRSVTSCIALQQCCTVRSFTSFRSPHLASEQENQAISQRRLNKKGEKNAQENKNKVNEKFDFYSTF